VSEPTLLLLEEWAAGHFKTPPSLWTLRGMARNGFFDPPAVKLGKAYYVRADVQVRDPHRRPTLVDRLKRA
jgi:hypothetical protein